MTPTAITIRGFQPRSDGRLVLTNGAGGRWGFAHSHGPVGRRKLVEVPGTHWLGRLRVRG